MVPFPQHTLGFGGESPSVKTYGQDDPSGRDRGPLRSRNRHSYDVRPSDPEAPHRTLGTSRPSGPDLSLGPRPPRDGIRKRKLGPNPELEHSTHGCCPYDTTPRWRASTLVPSHRPTEATSTLTSGCERRTRNYCVEDEKPRCSERSPVTSRKATTGISLRDRREGRLNFFTLLSDDEEKIGSVSYRSRDRTSGPGGVVGGGGKVL